MVLDLATAAEPVRTEAPLLGFDTAALELLPAAVYVCNADGVVLRYNRRAAELWGRAPVPGDPEERFCGSIGAAWPDGRPVTPDASPMAAVLRSGRPVHDAEFCLLRPDGSRLWVVVNVEPIRDGAGRVIGGINCFQDITRRRLAEAREREHQAVLQAVFDTTPECIKVVAADGALWQMNRAGLRMIGADSLDAVRGKPVAELIAPEHRETWCELHDRVCRGESLSWSFDLLLANGERRHMETHAAPLPMPDGSTAHLGVTRDVTERRQDRQRLENSEARLRELLDALPAAIYTTDSAGRITFYNRAAEAIAGRKPRIGEDDWCVSWRLYDTDGTPVPHESCPMAVTLQRAEPVRGAELIVERPDGGRVPILPYPELLRDAAGKVVGGVNMLVDISARKDAERRQQLLVNELNHRVKNTLATVQSIAAQTFRDEADTPARRWFDDRLMALSRVHDILNREHWEGAALGDIVLQSVAPLGDPQRRRFTIDGPELRIPPGMALSLAMALHELCTNAAKYGALSGRDGQVAIGWSARQDRLQFRWQETGGPPVRPPAAKGFGARLIERGLARELGGSARLDFAPGGVVCEIDAPLP